MIKTTRVSRALKQMKSGFLPKPQIRTLFGRKTEIVFENHKGNEPWHPNSILRIQYQPITLHSCQINYTCTAKFHHLAENALLAWTAGVFSKNSDVALRFSGLEGTSGMRNYAKDVDSKESPPIDKKKDINHGMDDDSAARFAEAKRILKEKRMSKGMDYPKKSPFEEP